MKKNQLFSALIFISLLFTACNPSDENGSNQNDDAFAENFGNTISRDFIGQVIDADNHPLQNVTVKIGSSTVQTDVNGVFIVNGASVHEKFAYITATKAGYMSGSRAMVPTSGKNNVKIMLIPNAPLETISSGVESEVAIYSGTKVKFDGAFQDENGNAYTGDVQVSMFHLTPSDENLSSLMPGMLYAQTSTNQEAVLETFGMMNVELRGSAGQKLNIANGHTAKITMRIDDSQLSTAPNSIPLWHFDDVKGYWKEDGLATKVGNNYVGEVSHFSWWNCDVSFPVVRLTLKVTNETGNPLSNLTVRLIFNGLQSSGVTDSQGIVSALIPMNQTLQLTVYPPSLICNSSNTIYATSVGPFTIDTTLPNIVINSSATLLTSNVVGNLLKCDTANVTNGYVKLTRNGIYSISPVTNGAFNFTELYCPDNTNFTLVGVNFDENQYSTPISLNFISPQLNVQGIRTCNAISSYMTYKIDDGPTLNVTGLLGFTDFGGERQVRAYPMNGIGVESTSHFVFFGVASAGTYSNFASSLKIEGNLYNLTNKTFVVTNMGTGGGQYFDAILTGNYTNFQTSTQHTLQVNFHIFRM